MRQAAILCTAMLTMTACAAPSQPGAQDSIAPAEEDHTVDDADPVDDRRLEGPPVTVKAVETGPYEGVPEAVPAGAVTFVFEQEDTSHRARHDFRLEELDVGTPIIASGSAEFTVELEPGTYTYYCSVAAHRDRGMEGEIVVVQEPDPGS